VRTPVDRYTAALERSAKGMRIGVPRRYFYERLDGEVSKALETAIGVLKSLGAEVRDIDVSISDTAIMRLLGLILAEAQHIHAERLKTKPGDFGADVAAILANPMPSAPEVIAAIDETHKLTVAMREALEGVDLLVTATTPIPATKIGQESVAYAGIEEAPIFAMIRCTAPFNATRLPALSLPCGFTKAGLPIGMQLIGRPFDESTILAAGHAYEHATEWHTRRPSL